MALVSWGIMWYISMLERHVFDSKENQNKKTQNQTKTQEGRKDCKFSPSHGDSTPYLGCLGTCATGLREYLKETTFPEVCIKGKLESFKVAKNHLSLEGC